MTEKYGFVYIWRDNKKGKYYIGCRWGDINDGYICSSNWMLKTYKRRPNEFKRRILKTNILCRKQLLLEEYCWLSMIKEEELGKKYYNLHNHHFKHWSINEQSRLTIGEKISASPNRSKNISKALTGLKRSEETKKKISESLTGGTQSDESNEKRRQANYMRDYTDPVFRAKMSFAAKNRSAETRAKISANNKRLMAEGIIGLKDRTHSDETKFKMSISAKNRKNNKLNTNTINFKEL